MGESDIFERYDVWVYKKSYGETHMGIQRSTFLIDPEENVTKVWRKVKVPGHLNKVLETVRTSNRPPLTVMTSYLPFA